VIYPLGSEFRVQINYYSLYYSHDIGKDRGHTMKGKPLRLIIVEDNSDDAELSVRRLEEEGFIVDWRLVDTKETLRAALADPPDLILADYSLPSFTAFDSIEIHHEMAPHIPLLVISGTIGEEAAVECIRAGATDYVLKDKIFRLGSVVKRALEEAESARVRLRTEKDLQKSRSRYRRLIDTIPHGILEFDLNGIITFGSRSLCRMMGYREEELIGKPIWDFSVPGSPKKNDIQSTLSRLIEKRPPPTAYYVPLLTKSSDRIDARVDWDYQKADERSLVSFIAVITDITEQKFAEEERQELERQLYHSQKMEAVGQLASGIAHDFNNLLQAIIGYGEMMNIDLPPGSSSRESLTEIRRAADRAATLIRQLLLFSRSERFESKILDMNRIVVDLLKMLRRILGERVELITRFDADLKPIMGDPGQIEQLLVNICINARDAMPRGGRITIATESVHVDRSSYLELDEGEYIRVSLSDTGTGISQEVLGRIFEPFFTTKEIGEGTGLGLATAYAVVQRHGGTIDVKSTPGEGSSFQIYLPALEGWIEEEDKSSGGEDHPPGGNETILLAEDDPQARNLIATVLERAGYRVLVAPDGEAALLLFSEHENELDLALIDAVMPKRDGRYVYEKIRNVLPRLPLIFISGYSGDLMDFPDTESDSYRWIHKPFPPDDLLRLVRQELDSSRID